MIANKNTVDTIVYLVKSDMISPRQGADIAKKIIFDIGWESIPVEEDVDGEVTYALSIIEDIEIFKGGIAEVEKNLLSADT